MSKRNLYLLSLAVVVLIGLALVQKSSHDRSTSASDTSPVLGTVFAADEINRVLVSGGADSTEVVLERLPDHWVARSAWNHPVDQRKIDELLATLDGLTGQYRSDSAAILADYGLGPDAEPVTLTLYGKEWEPVYTLEIGRKPASGAGAFVRDPASNAVFLTRANVLGKLGMHAGPAGPENKFFLDLKVFDCKREDIEAITLHDGNRTLAMEKVFTAPAAAEGDTVTAEPDRSTWEWVLVEPERRPLAKTKVDGIMNALTNIQASDIDDPKTPMEDYGLWKAARRVEVALADGTDFELRVGELREHDAGQKDYFVMTSRDRTIWTLRDYKIDQIFKQLEDLLPES
ncbi:DUF4340 domain-containing protein [bacterium]|nr:DUF4340 domain-containing protein [bacterium]MBU1072664.1 DUF4340 domain-containing protein [bacterium]MBU1676139.1 DUF4340 domain-containing protein [bacterium]